jgi:hypothetical protein
VTPATRTTDPMPQQGVLAAGAAGAYVGRYQLARLLRSPIEFDVTDLDGQLLVRSSAFASQPVFPIPGRAHSFRPLTPRGRAGAFDNCQRTVFKPLETLVSPCRSDQNGMRTCHRATNFKGVKP